MNEVEKNEGNLNLEESESFDRIASPDNEPEQELVSYAEIDAPEIHEEGGHVSVLEREAAKRNDVLKEVLEWVRMLVLVLLAGLFLTHYVLQRNTVQGTSMYPTLVDGDELFVEKVSRYFGGINRGDIITVDTTGLDDLDPNRVIKRVVGLPGETIEMKDGKVYINGELLKEEYLQPGVTTDMGRRNPNYANLTLGEDEYYCMGDNRPNSKDSRNFGPVPRKNILGHLLIRFYPFDRFGTP